MAIRIKRSSTGTAYKGFRPHFYGQYISRQGRVTEVKLRTPVRGTPPPSGLMKDKGDFEFEASRSMAELEFEKFLESNRDAKTAQALYAQSVRESSGRKVGDMPISDLTKWMRTYEHRPETQNEDRWIKWNFSVIDTFAEWAVKNGHPRVYSITEDVAQAYCIAKAKTRSKETLKHIIQRLKATFHAYMPFSYNPFERAYKIASEHLSEEADTVKKEPLSVEQIRDLWDVARETGEMWYDIVVCATCTGLRIGDVCNLKWEKVHIKDNIIHNVKNRKTGAIVSIPLFDYDENSEFYHPVFGELKKTLETIDISQGAHQSQFVFTKAHRTYTINPSKIYKTGKLLFARALNKGNKQVEVIDADNMTNAENPNDTIRAILSSRWTQEKKQRILQCYALWRKNLSYSQIAKELAYADKCRVSEDLHEIEKLVGCRIRPGNKAIKNGVTNRTLLRATRTKRVGRPSASLYGWHSLRHTFVIMAISAGVPVDKVRQIVGHTTSEMTQEYFNPTSKMAAEDMRQTLRRTAVEKSEKTEEDALSAVLKALPEKVRNKILQQAALELAKAKTPKQRQIS